MLILPWDASLDAADWQGWVATTERFGVLAVNNLDPAQAPLVVPTHFTVAGEELLLHLARPNPIWAHLEAAREAFPALKDPKDLASMKASVDVIAAKAEEDGDELEEKPVSIAIKEVADGRLKAKPIESAD